MLMPLVEIMLGVMGNIKVEQERLPLDGYSEGTYINDIYYL